MVEHVQTLRLRRWAMATVLVGAILRIATGLGSMLLAGPLLGLAALPLWHLGGAAAPVGEWLVFGGAVVAGLVIALQARDEPGRPARRLAIVVLADTAIYLLSFAVGIVALELDGSSLWPLAAANGIVIPLAIMVMRRAGAVTRERARVRAFAPAGPSAAAAGSRRSVGRAVRQRT